MSTIFIKKISFAIVGTQNAAAKPRLGLSEHQFTSSSDLFFARILRTFGLPIVLI